MANGTCSVVGCGRVGRVILGLCVGHYERVKKYGDPGDPYIKPSRVKIPAGAVCQVEPCDRPAYCRGWCKSHHSRWERHGDVYAGIPIGPAAKDKTRKPKPARKSPAHAADLTCLASGCTDPQYIKGHCIRHNARIKAYGSLAGGSYEFSEIIIAGRGLSREEKFWQRVDFDGPIPETRADLGPCWQWRLSLNSQGYGQTFLFPKIGTGAHRVAWHLAGRILVKTMELDHLCRNPKCLRVTHLEQVTKLENMLRGNGWSGRNRRKTRCPKGHDYDQANTLFNAAGHRKCRVCAHGKATRLAAERALTREGRAVARAYRLAIASDPCRYCGNPGEEVDHFYPIDKGGSAAWWNLISACRRCNRSKRAQCGTWFRLRQAAHNNRGRDKQLALAK